MLSVAESTAIAAHALVIGSSGVLAAVKYKK